MPNPVPIPLQDPIARRRDPKLAQGQVDKYEGLLTEPWIRYFSDQGQTVSDTPQRVAAVTLITQGAAIAATTLPLGSIASGLYRVSYYARITRAATVNSSLTITISWTEGGVSPSFSGAAMVGNTTTTVQSGVFMIEINAASPVTYAAAYVSNGATSMQFRLSVAVERVNV